jgi:CubicO group peptidase (beta-lactamase class C family)
MPTPRCFFTGRRCRFIRVCCLASPSGLGFSALWFAGAALFGGVLPPRQDLARSNRRQRQSPRWSRLWKCTLYGGMTTFDSPGLAIGIVADDRLVYSKGFGVRGKAGAEAVDPRTLFQIGSTTKAFLAASIALMVDRGKLRWEDRIIDLEPEFQLHDPCRPCENPLCRDNGNIH